MHLASDGNDVGGGGGEARVVTREKKVMSVFMRGQGRVLAWPMPRRRRRRGGEEGGFEGELEVETGVVMGVVATIRVRGGRGWRRARAEVVRGDGIVSGSGLGGGVGIVIGVWYLGCKYWDWDLVWN